MRQYAIGLSFVAMAGCSFVFVSGPPANHREVPSFDCSSSRVVPILDTVFTAWATLSVLGTLSLSDAEWDENFAPQDPPFSRKAGTIGYGAAGVLGAAGMVYGYMKTGACRRAKAEWTVRMQQGQGMQPGAQPGTWPPPAGTQPGTWPPPGGAQPPAGAQPPGGAQPPTGTQAPTRMGPGTWPLPLAQPPQPAPVAPPAAP